MKTKLSASILLLFFLASCMPVSTNTAPKSKKLAISTPSESENVDEFPETPVVPDIPASLPAPSGCSIVSTPNGQTMATSDLKTLTVNCSVGDQLTYAWRRNNITLSSAQSLVLSNLAAGSYIISVTASNSSGSQTQSLTIVVSGGVIAPSGCLIAATPNSSLMTTAEAKTLVLNCSQGNNLFYTWKKNGVTVANTQSLRLSNLAVGNYTYSATASNSSGGQSVNQAIQVTAVASAPPITKTPESVPANALLQGKNEGIVDIEGAKVLKGWACAQGLSTPVDVKIYRGMIGGGAKVYVGSTKANLENSSGAVSTACKNSGNHGFQYAIHDSLKASWSGQEITVEAIPLSGMTAASLILPAVSDGGVKRIPAMATTNASQFAGFFTPVIDQANSNTIPVYANYGLHTQTPVKALDDFVFLGARYIGTDFLTAPDNGTTNNSGIWSNATRTKMVINTLDLEKRGLYTAITGGGPHIWIAETMTNGPYPWFASNQDLVLQINAEMLTVNLRDAKGNTAQRFGDARTPVTQLSFGFYLHDDTTGKTIAYIVPIYESRGPYAEHIGNDTAVNFASSPLLDSSRYITKSPFSKSMKSLPYGGNIADNFFRIHVSAANLAKVIADANSTRAAGLSSDLKNYRLTFAGVMFELPNYVAGASNVSEANVMGFSVYLNRY